jgi:hypothetical protein
VKYDGGVRLFFNGSRMKKIRKRGPSASADFVPRKKARQILIFQPRRLDCRSRRRAILEAPENSHEQIDGQQPDQNYLPQTQIACAVMIRHHLRIALEKLAMIFENVDADKEHERETETEEDAQWQN